MALMRSRSSLLVCSLIVIVAAAAGVWAASVWLQPTPAERRTALQQDTTATVLPGDYARLPDVAVSTAQGQRLHRALRGEWSLLFLGFTHCPDVCPVTMQALAATAARMDGDTMPEVAFVSVDPQRDSPANANRYAAEFNPNFIGATGDMDALRELAGTLRVDFRVPDKPADAEYSVEHPSAVFLIDPQGRLRALFSSPHDPAAMATDLRAIHETFGSPS